MVALLVKKLQYFFRYLVFIKLKIKKIIIDKILNNNFVNKKFSA